MAYSNYPKAMTSNARRGRELNAKRGGSCATPTGKATARILADRAPLAKSRVIRMYKYLQRAETYYDPNDTSACGTISYLLWGGLAAKRWSEARWREIQAERQKRQTVNRSKLTAQSTRQMDNFEQEIRTAYGEGVETRQMEIRAADTDMVLEGYAARYDETTNLGYFNERIARGAFTDTMENDVRFLLNHKGMPMARTNNGTLKLEDREDGLYATATLNDTQQSRDVYAAVKRGDIDSMSFAFTIAEDSHNKEENLRTVTKVKTVYDVSAVSFPAYPTTTLEARDAFSAKQPTPDEPTPQPTTPTDSQKSKSTEERNFTPQHTQKNMNLHDLKGQRATYYEEFVEIGKLADTEGRAMTEAEQERADRLDELIQATDAKIKHKVREQEMVKRVAYSTAPASAEGAEVDHVNSRFSLSRAVTTLYRNDKLEGAEAEWAQEASREFRGSGIQMAGEIGIPLVALSRSAADKFTADGAKAGGTAADGTGFVATNVPSAIAALRAPTVLERLGAQTFSAQGNLKFPRISEKAETKVATEVADIDSAGLEMDEVNMNPNRAGANTTYSKQLLIQGGPDVDRIIAQDLRAALSEKVDTFGFAIILQDTDIGDLTAASGSSSAGGDLAVGLEKAVLAAGGNLDGAAYAMSPLAFQHFKTAYQVNAVSGVFEAGRYNGYTGIPTPHLSDGTNVGKVIFGNFNQGVLVAKFGGIDLLVDPFSKAQTGMIQLHATHYFDVAVRQPGALAHCEDVIAQ